MIIIDKFKIMKFDLIILKLNNVINSLIIYNLIKKIRRKECTIIV